MTRQQRRRRALRNLTDDSKYDVNGDGAVDNTDASLSPAAAIGIQAYVAKYDVNGDKQRSTSLTSVLVFDEP